MTVAAPLPTPDADSAPFWAACKDGRLTAQRCPSCGRFRWPPMEFCPWCHHHGGEWTDLPGTGSVRSFVIVHRAFDPGFEDRVPYVVAHVTLDDTAEDVTIMANLDADPAESAAVGQRVRVTFAAAGPFALPRFQPT